MKARVFHAVIQASIYLLVVYSYASALSSVI